MGPHARSPASAGWNGLLGSPRLFLGSPQKKSPSWVGAGLGADDAALRGDDLLEALQAGSCWRPSALSSTRLVLCFGEHFGEHFELIAALDPRRGAVTSVELGAKLRPAAQPDARPASVTLLAALFPAVEAELCPLLAACESSRQLPALMQASSMRLGRLLELAREVYALEARRSRTSCRSRSRTSVGARRARSRTWTRTRVSFSASRRRCSAASEQSCRIRVVLEELGIILMSLSLLLP